MGYNSLGFGKELALESYRPVLRHLMWKTKAYYATVCSEVKVD